MKRTLRLLLLRALALAARPLVRRAPTQPARVLYIKPDHLGDLLLATPALALLRARLPAAHITALVGPWAAMMLARNPAVDTLLTCPFPGFERKQARRQDDGVTRRQGDGVTVSHHHVTMSPGHMSPVSRVRSLIRPYLLLLHHAWQLRAARYDAAIIGRDDHWWGAALAALAGIPLRVGFAVPECRPFLTTALPWSPGDHVAAQGLALVQALAGAPPTGTPTPATCYEPAPEDHAWAEDWLRAQGIAAERLAIIHPGTAGPTKLWASARWAAVADALVARGMQLVLTGGPGEEPLVAEVAGHMRAGAIQLAGRTGIGQLAALLRRATLVLGVDSGPLHLAAAQGTRTLHLYGPGDAGRFGPWGPAGRHRVLRAELACSPCGVFTACPRGLAQPECMQRIEVEEVVRSA